MKTPEEWLEFSDKQITGTTPEERLSQRLDLLKQIQLDAWKQGMTDAATLCNKNIMKETFNEGDWHMSESASQIKEAILNMSNKKQPYEQHHLSHRTSTLALPNKT